MTYDGMEEVEVPDLDGVRGRLGELGLPLELIHGSLRQGQIAADFCTKAHPSFYPGLVMYGETNGAMRGALALRAWSFSDENNIPRAISPNGSVVITAVSGNANTGLRGEAAQTRHPRGAAGLRIVRRKCAARPRGHASGG